jgi:hypothetical protein
MKYTEKELADRRSKIIADLNQPTFIERKQMKEQGITWEELRAKLNIKTYK